MNVAFLCLLAAALCGGAGLLLELGWLRTAAAALPGTVPAGALVVPVFLSAWAAGAALGGRFADARGGLGGAARWLGLAGLATLVGPSVGERLLADAAATSLPARVALGGLPVLPAAFLLGGALPLLTGVRRRAGLQPARATGAVACWVALGGVLGVAAFRPTLAAGSDPGLLAAGALVAAALVCWLLDLVADDSDTSEARPARASTVRGGDADLANGDAEVRAANAASVPQVVLLAVSVAAGVLLVGGQIVALRVLAQSTGDSLATTSEVLTWLHVGMAVGALVLCVPGGSASAVALSALLLVLGAIAPLLLAPSAGVFGAGRSLPMLLLGVGAGNLVTAASRARVRAVPRFASWIGDLSAGSTLGGVAGGLIVSLVLVPATEIGTPGAARVLALVGLVAAGLLALFALARRGLRVAGVLALLLTAGGGALFATRPALELPWRTGPDEVELLALSEGPYGVVSLVGTSDGQERLKLDNRFGLGGSAGVLEHRLGRIAAALRPEAHDALLLGLGAGNTLAGLSDSSHARIDCVERNAQILALGLPVPYPRGLAPAGPTPEVHHADARRWIAEHPRAYDLVVGDLFFPWVTGAGDLLSAEHFARVRTSLRDDGVYVQWLPLHQLPWPAFGSVCRAFLRTFPAARLMVATPLSDQPLVALVGGLAEGLPRAELVDALLSAAPVGEGPAGHADLLDLLVCDSWGLEQRFAHEPVNTLAHPVSELRALGRENDEAEIARTNMAQLARLVTALDVMSSGRLTGNQRDTRALGVELQARADALSALLQGRAQRLELLALPPADERGQSDEERFVDVSARLDGALLTAWSVFPGHLGARAALLERGASLGAQGRWLDGAKLLAAAVEAHADGPLAAMLGGVFLRLGRAEDAVDLLRQARVIAPDNRSLLVNLGSALVQTGDDAEAEEVLQLAERVFRPEPLPVLQATALGLLLGEREAVPVGQALLAAMDPTEPWRAALERLLVRVEG